MINEWKDETSYRQGERGKVEPRCWELCHGELRLVVFRRRDEAWAMSTYPIKIFEDEYLGELSAEKAKAVSIDKLVSCLGSMFHLWHACQAEYLKALK